jgi:hypothetical protein
MDASVSLPAGANPFGVRIRRHVREREIDNLAAQLPRRRLLPVGPLHRRMVRNIQEHGAL